MTWYACTYVRIYVYILMVLQGRVMRLVFVQRQPECSGLGGGGDGQSFDHETRTHPTHMTLWVGELRRAGPQEKRQAPRTMEVHREKRQSHKQL